MSQSEYLVCVTSCDEELVSEIQTKLQNYHPKKVRRKIIEKDNGKYGTNVFGLMAVTQTVIPIMRKQRTW